MHKLAGSPPLGARFLEAGVFAGARSWRHIHDNHEREFDELCVSGRQGSLCALQGTFHRKNNRRDQPRHDRRNDGRKPECRSAGLELAVAEGRRGGDRRLPPGAQLPPDGRERERDQDQARRRGRRRARLFHIDRRPGRKCAEAMELCKEKGDTFRRQGSGGELVGAEFVPVHSDDGFGGAACGESRERGRERRDAIVVSWVLPVPEPASLQRAAARRDGQGWRARQVGEGDLRREGRTGAQGLDGILGRVHELSVHVRDDLQRPSAVGAGESPVREEDRLARDDGRNSLRRHRRMAESVSERGLCRSHRAGRGRL